MIRTTTGVLCLALAGLLLVFAVQILWSGPYGLAARIPRSLLVGLVIGRLVYVGRYLRSEKEWNSRRLVPVTLLVLVAIVMTSYAATITYVNHRLESRFHADAYDGPYKVWANRGLVPETAEIVRDGDQNSIESFRRAFARGAKGAEVDVFYDTERSEFIVSHDRPYHLKNGKLLTLAALFEASGEEAYYWLDFKKQRSLSADELQDAVAALEVLVARGDRKERVYVEGEAPFSLIAFQRAGFRTIMDTHPLADENPLTPTLINVYKAIYYFGGFTVIGMPAGRADQPIYGRRTRRSLDRIPVFLYHAPDDAAFLDDLVATSSVRVVMLRDHSVSRYDLKAAAGAPR